MPETCFYCGHSPATQPLKTTDSFDKSQCRSPFSEVMCDRCSSLMFGDLAMGWYWNPNAKPEPKWSNMWTRSCSFLLKDRDILHHDNYPQFGEVFDPPETKGRSGNWRLIKSLPTRVQMRDWLTNPPEPPFEICIAVSGQKHTLFLSEAAHSRDYFPVQLELEQVWVDRAEFIEALETFEALMGLGFVKDEIETGNYSTTRIMPVMAQWIRLENQIKRYRGTGLMRLTRHVAQRPEQQESAVVVEAPPAIAPTVAAETVEEKQLSLWG